MKAPQTIKPIETVYNGYKFRSRLEARWAVFFDKLGIAYDYEAEGYDLGGVWYLPDFWLRDNEVFAEIKPMAELRDYDEKQSEEYNEEIRSKNGEIIKYQIMAGMLSDQSQKDVLVIIGSPWPNEYFIHLYPPTDDTTLRNIHEPSPRLQFGECRRCHAIWLWHPYDFGIHFDTRINVPECKGCWERYPTDFERLDVAFTSARQARF